MPDTVTPMLHVPDVRATVDWYSALGFTVRATYDDGGAGLSFAIVSFGTGQVMFNQGGRTGSDQRRDVDLYIQTDRVEELYERFRDDPALVEPLSDREYGMREFLIRDPNGFWVTFGRDLP